MPGRHQISCGFALTAVMATLAWLAPGAVAQCGPDSLGVSRTITLTSATPPVESLLEEGEIVLTFDDGPHLFRTRSVLEALEAECTQASFFLLGKAAVAHPDVVREILAGNHTIGSHSWNHANLAQLPLEDAMTNALAGKAAVDEAAGAPTVLLRLPFIETTPELSAALAEEGLIPVTVTVDGEDWTNNTAEASVAMIMAKLEANDRRGIVLLHDPMRASALRTSTLLKQLRKHGYRVVALKGPDS